MYGFIMIMIYTADFVLSRFIWLDKSKILKFGFVLLQKIGKFIHNFGTI